MKRNDNLIPLSWEHHSGLVFARRIRKRMESGDSIPEIKNYILVEWNNSLKRHFELEETIIAPVFNKYVPADPELNRMENDHNRMREIIGLLNGKNFTGNELLEFSKLLTKHIRFEEEVLFPLFEEKIPETEMHEIGMKLKSTLTV